MTASQPNLGRNVIPFRKRSGDDRAPADDARSESILRMLDLAKFEQDRRSIDHGASMRSNIAAMVLLGLLVFIATEDFYRLEQSNMCLQTLECMN